MMPAVLRRAGSSSPPCSWRRWPPAVPGCRTRSRVSEGRRLDEPINDQYRVAAQSPFPGASPEQIARGFIRAGEDQTETHATAKAYLTEPSVGSWRWSAHDTVIYNRASDLRVRKTGRQPIEVSVTPVGMLAPDGRYRDAEPGTVIRTTFGLTQVAGEWRLELPEDGFGVWLEATAFDNLYVAVPVHYVMPSGRELVPDTRWFPRGPLAGHEPGARPARAGAASPRRRGEHRLPCTATRLAVDSVPIESGHAQVDLTSSAFSAGLEERRAMWAQLSATLSRANVSSISISVEGTELDLAGVGTTLSTPQEVGYGLHACAGLRLSPHPQRKDASSGSIPTFIPDDANAQGRRGVQSLKPDDPNEPDGGWTQLTLSRDGKPGCSGRRGPQRSCRSGRRTRRWSVSRGTGATSSGPPMTGTTTSGSPAGLRGRHGSGPSTRRHSCPSRSPSSSTCPGSAGERHRGTDAVGRWESGARHHQGPEDRNEPAAGRRCRAGVQRTTGGARRATPPGTAAQPDEDVAWLGTESYAVLGRLTDREGVQPWIGHIGRGLDGLRVRLGQSDPSLERLEKPVPRGARTITTAGGQRGLICLTEDDKVMAKAGTGLAADRGGHRPARARPLTLLAAGHSGIAVSTGLAGSATHSTGLGSGG